MWNQTRNGCQNDLHRLSNVFRKMNQTRYVSDTVCQSSSTASVHTAQICNDNMKNTNLASMKTTNVFQSCCVVALLLMMLPWESLRILRMNEWYIKYVKVTPVQRANLCANLSHWCCLSKTKQKTVCTMYSVQCAVNVHIFVRWRSGPLLSRPSRRQWHQKWRDEAIVELYLHFTLSKFPHFGACLLMSYESCKQATQSHLFDASFRLSSATECYGCRLCATHYRLDSTLSRFEWMNRIHDDILALSNKCTGDCFGPSRRMQCDVVGVHKAALSCPSIFQLLAENCRSIVDATPTTEQKEAETNTENRRCSRNEKKNGQAPSSHQQHYSIDKCREAY